MRSVLHILSFRILTKQYVQKNRSDIFRVFRLSNHISNKSLSDYNYSLYSDIINLRYVYGDRKILLIKKLYIKG